MIFFIYFIFECIVHHYFLSSTFVQMVSHNIQQVLPIKSTITDNCVPFLKMLVGLRAIKSIPLIDFIFVQSIDKCFKFLLYLQFF